MTCHSNKTTGRLYGLIILVQFMTALLGAAPPAAPRNFRVGTGGGGAPGVYHAEQFGVIGDGVHDDTAAIAAALAAVPSGGTLLFRSGTFVNTGNFVRNTPIRFLGAGPDTRFRQVAGAMFAWFGGSIPNGTPYADLAPGLTLHFQGGIVAGQRVFDVPSTAGLSVGEKVLFLLGQDPFDSGQNKLRHWSRITALGATRVTIETAVPEDVSATFKHDYTFSPTAHTLHRFDVIPANFEIGNLSLEQIGNAAWDSSSIAVMRASDVSVHDLTFLDVEGGLIVGECEKGTVERLRGDRVRGLSYGSFQNTYGSRDITLTDLSATVGGVGIYLENQDRNVRYQNVTLTTTVNASGRALVMALGGGKGLHLTHVTLDGRPMVSKLPCRYVEPGNEIANVDDLVTEDFTIMGPPSGVASFHLKHHQGSISYKGYVFSHIRRQTVHIPLTPGLNGATFELPVGFYRNVKAKISSRAGVQQVLFRNASGGTAHIYDPANSADSLPADGVFALLVEGPHDPTVFGAVIYPFTDDPTGRVAVVSTTSPVEGNELVLEIEYFTQS